MHGTFGGDVFVKLEVKSSWSDERRACESRLGLAGTQAGAFQPAGIGNSLLRGHRRFRVRSKKRGRKGTHQDMGAHAGPRLLLAHGRRGGGAVIAGVGALS